MRILLGLFFLFIFPLSQAQSETANLGAIINSIADGIHPDAFKGKFSDDMENWKNASKGIDGLDVRSFKDQLGALIGGLKGKAFDETSRGELLTELTGVNGLAGMKEVLNSLVSGLDPDLLKEDFKENKDNILNSLNNL